MEKFSAAAGSTNCGGSIGPCSATDQEVSGVGTKYPNYNVFFGTDGRGAKKESANLC